jgi:hypothetical protein
MDEKTYREIKEKWEADPIGRFHELFEGLGKAHDEALEKQKIVSSEKPKIICDLDGTLGKNIFSMNKELKSEFERENPEIFTHESRIHQFENTKVYPNANFILNSFYDSHEIIILTGRSEKYRPITEFWLGKNGFIYHKLIMIEKDWETMNEYIQFKKKVIENENPVLVIEDDSEVIKRLFPIVKPANSYLINSEKDWDLQKIKSIIESAEYRKKYSQYLNKEHFWRFAFYFISLYVSLMLTFTLITQSWLFIFPVCTGIIFTYLIFKELKEYEVI